MSALFISYTGRDPEGEAWAERLADWCGEWGYGFFRDKDHSHGIKGGTVWRASWYQQLGLAEALICLCTRQYESSPWCVGEVAIAVKEGKTVIPIHLAETPEDLNQQPLPLLLQDSQAIRVIPANAPAPEQLAEVKSRLRRTLEAKLNWWCLLPWDENLPPYPGLAAFEAHQAPVFFGRDGDIQRMSEMLASLALRPDGFLLLLGASGSGKSSLVRAGVVPRLRACRDKQWLVLDPFKPGLDPFVSLRGALRPHLDAAGLLPRERDGEDGEDASLSRQFRSLCSAGKAKVLLVIDQFEELLSYPSRPGEGPGVGERFLGFLEGLLQHPAPGVLVLATLRSDFLIPLQNRWPTLTAKASIHMMGAIAPSKLGELIIGPAARSGLTLQPGLAERLVAESGGSDALSLLAFVLEKLWHCRQNRGCPVQGPRGERWDLTINDYEIIGGFSGAVSFCAAHVFNHGSHNELQLSGLRETFLQMCRIDGTGHVSKRLARWEDTPMSSRNILQRFINARILFSTEDEIGITHDSLLQAWPLLKGWIEESKEFLVWKQQVELDAEQWHGCIDNEKSDLLLSGIRLMNARKWLDQSGDAIQSQVKVFLEASIMHAERAGASLVELAKSFGLASVVEQYNKQEIEYQDILSRVSELKKALDRATKKRDEAQRLLLNEIPKVFISYASEDENEARKIHKLLSKTGFQCWFDKETLVPGVDWEQEIRRAIRKTDFIIILISTRSRNKRGYMQREIKLALQVNEEIPENQAFIIPARIEECEIPHQLSRYHYCDIFDEGGEQRLAESILIHWNSRSQSLRDQGD